MKTKIDDIFPLLQITEEGLVVSKNADLSYFFAIEYPEVFITSQASYSAMVDAILSAARSLGEGYLVHKQDFFLEDRYRPDFSYNQQADPILLENEKHFRDRPFTNHKGFLYITLPASDPTSRSSAASSLFKRSLVPKGLQNAKAVAAFREKVAAFVSGVNQTRSLHLVQLNRDQIVGTRQTAGLLNYYFTLSFDETHLYDINRENANFKVGGQNTYTFAINDLDQFPPEVNPLAAFRDFSGSSDMPISLGSSFGLNLPFNHIYNQVFSISRQQEVINQKTQDIKRHHSFSQWSRDNTFSVEQKTRFLDTMKNGELAVKAHFNVLIFHEDLEVLREYREITSGAISNAQFTAKIATTFAEQLFWSCIPGNAQELGYDNLLSCLLPNAISLFNLETNYRDSPYQPNGLLLTDRFGVPRIVDIFYKPLEERLIANRNFTIVGPSGSGKSFAINNLIYYLRYSGAHITIVDIGHSYKRQGEMLGAKYIEHSDEKPISLNPFFTEVNIDGLGEEDAQKVREDFKNTLVQILILLYKKENEPVSKAEEVTLFNMVHYYFRHLEKNNARLPKTAPNYIKPGFNSFYEFTKNQFPAVFKEHGGRENIEFDLVNFHYVLTPFYQGGQYDYLLNGDDETDLSRHPFVIYELDNIKDHPILLPIITLVITNTYITKLFEVRGTLKVLLIEEAWKAISSDFFATFLLWAFKTARKHFGSIGVVTQEIEDLLKSEIIKETIIQSTDIKIIMDINKYEESPETIFNLFKISSSFIPQIFSINKPLPSSRDRGRYKELALILGKQCKVYGTEVSKYAYSLFTTEPTEVDQIKALKEKTGLSLFEAAIVWADQRK